MQVQHIGHSIRNARETSGDPDTFPAHAGFSTKQLVLAVHQADINPDLSGQVLFGSNLQTYPRVSRIFDRHPRMLQEQALLRVDVFRFLRRDIEKQRIELIDSRKKAPPFALMGAALAAIFTVVSPPVPTLLRDLLDAVLSSAQVLPILPYTG